MLEAYLLDHKWLLVGGTFLITGANVLLASIGQKAFESQEWIKQERYVAPGLGGQIMRSPARRAAGPLIFAALVLVMSLSLGRDGLGVLAGGMLVMHFAAALMSIGTVLNVRALWRSGAATGQLTYSAAYRYSLAANQFLSCALVVWLAFLLRGGPILFGGGLFLLASAAGYYRRSRQADRASSIPVRSGAA